MGVRRWPAEWELVVGAGEGRGGWELRVEVRMDLAWDVVTDMDFDLSWTLRWRAPLGLGIVGADSDERRGEIAEDDSICVEEESGEAKGTECAAMEVLSCSDAGFDGPAMYGRADPESH